MALKLADKWVWDCWFAFDGEHHHVFFLHASKALGDPDRRHRNVMVGHAISTDLTNWTIVRDAIAVSPSPAFDSYTTWTGSVIKDDDGLWWMFYTGTSREDGGNKQTIGAATSTDLMMWNKLENNPLVQADGTWYETMDQPHVPAEHCRDPWVFRKPGSDLWHMLFTARANHGSFRQRGIVGHATSNDLKNWKVEKPLSDPDTGFHELEVLQYAIVDGVPLIVFCCNWMNISDERLAEVGKRPMTYSVVVDTRLEHIDITKAKPFGAFEYYAGRLIQDTTGGWNLIGFVDVVEGEFQGYLPDPVPVTADPVNGLTLKLN